MSYFFIRLIIDFKARIFLILHIKKFKIYISSVWKTFYIKKLKNIILIIKIFIIGSLVNFFFH